MRYYKLVTLERRGGTCFILKALDRTIIGTMTLNPQRARHELELTEPEFLRHSKALALLTRVPGCAVYVDAIRDDAPVPMPATPPVLPPDTRFHRLTKISREENIDLGGCTTNAERVARINQVRAERAAQLMTAEGIAA